MAEIGKMPTPWGIHHFKSLYAQGCQAGLPDGRWVRAVCEPYTGNRLVAAWWVLTGRAFAFLWPEVGDIEDIIAETTPARGLSELSTALRGRSQWYRDTYPHLVKTPSLLIEAADALDSLTRSKSALEEEGR